MQTAGRNLANYIEDHLLVADAWLRQAQPPMTQERALVWGDFITELMLLNTVGRLLRWVDHCAKTVTAPELIQRAAVDFLSSEFPLRDRAVLKKAAALAVSAWDVSDKPIPPSVVREVREYAQDNGHGCYLCGCELDWTRHHQYRAFAADHIWPSAFGGDSEFFNLLAACKACNGRKRDFLGWSQPSVQSIHLPPDVDNRALENLDGTVRFAVLFRHVLKTRPRNAETLRETLARLGPARITTVGNELPVDFFQLTISEDP